MSAAPNALVLLLWPVPLIGGLAYLIAWMVMPQDPLAVPAPATLKAQA